MLVRRSQRHAHMYSTNNTTIHTYKRLLVSRLLIKQADIRVLLQSEANFAFITIVHVMYAYREQQACLKFRKQQACLKFREQQACLKFRKQQACLKLCCFLHTHARTQSFEMHFWSEMWIRHLTSTCQLLQDKDKWLHAHVCMNIEYACIYSSSLFADTSKAYDTV
jgi:hypothetical protein